MITGEAIKNELKVTITLELLYKNHIVIRGYHKTWCH